MEATPLPLLSVLQLGEDPLSLVVLRVLIEGKPAFSRLLGTSQGRQGIPVFYFKWKGENIVTI